MNGVRSLRNVLVVLAALTWLSMTMHCRLETVNGLEFLTCQTESDYHGEPSSDCGDAGCCLVEQSKYKTEQYRLSIPLPNLLTLTFAPVLDWANALSGEVSRVALPLRRRNFPGAGNLFFARPLRRALLRSLRN